jgi:hypothetical protein
VPRSLRTVLGMPAHPTTAPGPSQTAARRAEKTAARVRSGAGATGPGLRLVHDGDTGSRLPSFLRAASADPHAMGARAGARLDPQARITCAKLLKGLGWQPGEALATHCHLERRLVLVRRVDDTGRDLDDSECACARCVVEQHAATALAAGWVAVGQPAVLHQEDEPPLIVVKGEPARVTSKGELALTRGMVRSAGLSVPGEVLILALPALDAVLVTSVEVVVSALLDGLDVLAADSGCAEDAAPDRPVRVEPDAI